MTDASATPDRVGGITMRRRDDGTILLDDDTTLPAVEGSIVARLAIADSGPSVAEGEITDKGSLYQRRTLSRRGAAGAALYEGGGTL